MFQEFVGAIEHKFFVSEVFSQLLGRVFNDNVDTVSIDLNGALAYPARLVLQAAPLSENKIPSLEVLDLSGTDFGAVKVCRRDMWEDMLLDKSRKFVGVKILV